MTDRETLRFYDESAAHYAQNFAKGPLDATLAAFLKRVPAGGRILDLGCGPGTDAAAMTDAGFDPDPIDASEGMVQFARDTHGLPARVATFDSDWGVETYDGIWASFSLLHAPRADLAGHIARLGVALKPGGAFYVGMKLGTGEQRDDLGRRYSYVTAAELSGWLEAAGLMVVESLQSVQTSMTGAQEPCIGMTAVKPL